MGATESRWTTIGMSFFAVVSIVAFVALYGPPLLATAPGSGVKPPMHVVGLLVFVLANIWWLPCVVMGVRQLFVRPRRYGLITIGFGVLHLTAYRVIEWHLVWSRGLYWSG
jgi:hypothetical protein